MESADSLISNLDASEREEALSLLVKRIAQFPLTVQKVLAMYYYEGFHAAEIAMCLALTKDDVEQILAEMLGLLQTALSVWRDLKLSRIAPSKKSFGISASDVPSSDQNALKCASHPDRNGSTRQRKEFTG